MIIDVAIRPMELENVPEDEVSALFSELGRASVLGYHRVFLNEDLAEWVLDANNVSLSNRHRQCFRDILEEISERGKQVIQAKCKMIIKIGVEKNIEFVEFYKNNRIDKLHWIVNHKNFVKGMTLDQTILLTENSMNDGQLLSKIFDLEAERIGLAPLDSFRFNGGGSGIDEIFSDLVGYGKICLGIADQDFYSSESKVGANLVNKHDKIKNKKVIGLVDLTLGDKAENFLPFEVIKIVVDKLRKPLRHSYEECFENLGKIEQIIKNNPDISEDIWLKLDLRKEFIPNNFTIVNTDSESKKLDSEYKKVKRISKNSPNGFSRKFNIVKRFLGSGDAISEFENFAKTDKWREFYESWLEIKIWFLCGDEIYSG